MSKNAYGVFAGNMRRSGVTAVSYTGGLITLLMSQADDTESLEVTLPTTADAYPEFEQRMHRVCTALGWVTR